jgi:hypothetical protein
MLAQKWKLWILIIFAIFIFFLGVIFIRNLVDFPVYYAAGQSLLTGRTDLYSPDFALGRVMDYRYPPVFLLVLTPLWLLPYKWAAYIWYLASVFEIAFIVYILRKLVSPFGTSKIAWTVTAIGVLQYIIILLHYGNAHLLAVCLLFGALYYGLQRKDIKAASLMALAITIKLTPAFLLVYFLLKRRWKFLGLVGGFILAINLLPVVFFGVAKNNELLKEWSQHVILNQEFHELNGPINLSLKGQLRRYFTAVNYQQRVDGDTHYPAVNLFSFSANRVDTVWLLLSGCMVCLAAYLIWKRDDEPQRSMRIESSDGHQKESKEKNVNPLETSLVELGLLISVMLFVEPLTSKIYFIALLWPIYILAVLAFEKASEKSRLIKGALIFIAILNFVLPLLPGRSIQRWLLALGVDFYVNLLILTAQISYLLALRKHHPLSIGEPQRPAL